MPARVEGAVAGHRTQVRVRQGELAERLKLAVRWRIGSTSALSSSLARYASEAASSGTGSADVTASLTNEGIEALGLQVGMAATAVFKACAVMVASQP